MRLVIKIAGALLESEETVQTIARQITELARAGHELLVIHAWASPAASSAACASPIAKRATRP
jgi:acetylglutamate kinase